MAAFITWLVIGPMRRPGWSLCNPSVRPLVCVERSYARAVNERRSRVVLYNYHKIEIRSYRNSYIVTAVHLCLRDEWANARPGAAAPRAHRGPGRGQRRGQDGPRHPLLRGCFHSGKHLFADFSILFGGYIEFWVDFHLFLI